MTPWTVAHQAPLSMGFSRQEYWSGLSFASPGDLPSSGIENMSPALAGGFFTTEPTWEAANSGYHCLYKDALSFKGFPCGSAGKESTCNAGDLGVIPGLGRFLGEGNGYPLQYSCLVNSKDRGAWWDSWDRKESDRTE